MDTIPQDIPQRQCTKCLQWKPATHDFFNIHKRARYGFSPVCRQCSSRRTTPLPEPAPDGHKRCNICKEIKPLTEFYRNRTVRDGYHGACKICHRISSREVIQRNISKLESQNTKECIRCKQNKLLIDFPKDNGYYRNVCKECKNQERRERVPGEIKILNEKRCPACRIVKSIQEFNLNPQRRDGHATYCRDCENLRKRVKGTTQKRREISAEEYDKKFLEQEGKCAICGTQPNSLCIDHDHQTGQIRDLLCLTCNLALGLLKEDSERVRSFLKYIDKWKTSEG